MTSLIFGLSVYMIGISLVLGLIGYHWKAGRWSEGALDYLSNLGVCILHAACWYAGLRLYLSAFGVPEVVEY
jgi:hypothetical protein